MTIALSPEAARQLGSEIGARVLRIAFTTGCGGSGYRMSLESAPNPDDLLVEEDGIRIALDDLAATHLDGAIIRYDEEDDGYLLDHPDAVTTVWCG